MLTQTALAAQLGLATQSSISHLESGRKSPSVALVLLIANFFAVTTEYLLRDAVPITDPASLTSAQTIYPFGERLRELREERNLSQATLGRALTGATQSHLSYIEHGQKAPSPELVIELADYFGITTDALLWGSPDRVE